MCDGAVRFVGSDKICRSPATHGMRAQQLGHPQTQLR
jgi:hypothetical protein